jgi:hypothetical protein
LTPHHERTFALVAPKTSSLTARQICRSAVAEPLRSGQSLGMSDPVRIVIGHPDETEAVVLEVRGRERPSSNYSDDGNWLVTRIDVQVGAFSAAIATSLRADELARLRADLEQLHAAIEGEAAFHAMEGSLELDLRGDGLGHINVIGCLRDRRDTALHFSLDVDRTYLPPMVEALRDVEGSWPAVGSA